MPSKMWIASKPTDDPAYEHLYFVYDPDGDPTTGDELVWRAGPENETLEEIIANNFDLGNIIIENWVPIDQSRDALNGDDPFADRNYTEVDTNGKTPEELRDEFSDFAEDMGDPNEDSIVLTDIEYTLPFDVYDPEAEGPVPIPALNSNSAVNSALNNSGIDLDDNWPIDGGQGSGNPRVSPDTYPGSESYIGASDGTTVINDTEDRNIYNDGGDNTYEYTPNSFGQGTTVIVEDNDASTIDKLVIKGVNPEDVEFRRTPNGDLEIYFPWDESGKPSLIVKDQWDGSGVPKMNSLVIEPPGGGDPIVIPLNNPDNFPIDLFSDLPEWFQGWIPGVDGSNFVRQSSPLVIDLDRSGTIDLTNVDGSEIHFDFWGDGFSEQTAWVAATDGLLVHDLDQDGLIEGMDELFGSNYPLGYMLDNFSLMDTENGFEKLAVWDLAEFGGNGDGVIDANDAVWSELQVWQDLNQDGISQAGELLTLDQVGLQSMAANDNAPWAWTESQTTRIAG